MDILYTVPTRPTKLLISANPVDNTPILALCAVRVFVNEIVDTAKLLIPKRLTDKDVNVAVLTIRLLICPVAVVSTPTVPVPADKLFVRIASGAFTVLTLTSLPHNALLAYIVPAVSVPDEIVVMLAPVPIRLVPTYNEPVEIVPAEIPFVEIGVLTFRVPAVTIPAETPPAEIIMALIFCIVAWKARSVLISPTWALKSPPIITVEIVPTLPVMVEVANALVEIVVAEIEPMLAAPTTTLMARNPLTSAATIPIMLLFRVPTVRVLT